MEKKCCVKKCPTNSGKNKSVVFYKFPKAEGQRKVWEKAMNVRGFKSDNATLLCSRHFLKENFHAIRGRSVLKKNAVPSLYLNPKPEKGRDDVKKGSVVSKKQLAKEAVIEDTQKDVKTSENESKQKQPTIQCVANETKAVEKKTIRCVANETKAVEKKNLSKCLVCQQPVAFMYEFLTNAHAHRAFILKKFICGHCLREFDSFSDLMSHITSIGSAKEYVPDKSELSPVPRVVPLREYPCSQCSATFGTFTARLYHELTHSAVDEDELCKKLNLRVNAEDEDSATTRPRPSGRRRKILAADPSEICLDEPQAKKSPVREEGTCKEDRCSHAQQAKKLCKANTPTGRKQLNTLSSLSPQKKQELVSIVYCNLCEQKFMSLRLLDKHYWAQHSNMDIPLDLAFEVGSGDVVPVQKPCSVCIKRTACVKAIQKLLDEAVTDMETTS